MIPATWPPSKVEYYKAAIGETFAIEAKEGKTWQEAWTDAGVTVEL